MDGNDLAGFQQFHRKLLSWGKIRRCKRLSALKQEMRLLRRKRHRQGQEGTAAEQIRQNFFGSPKNSRSVSRNSRSWEGKTEETKGERQQRRKRRQQTETAGSEALLRKLFQRGNRQEPPAKDPSRRKKPLKEQGKGRVAHPQVQSGRNAHDTMQEQKESSSPFQEGQGADPKDQSRNQAQCPHQGTEDLSVELSWEEESRDPGKASAPKVREQLRQWCGR